MIVPQYWAEARIQERRGNRQLTVRRFGWSEHSQDEAQANAEARVRTAFERIVSGEKLPRHEPKVAYNGADGVPIREEVLARHGDVVITRNAYGASCLNTPDVLFADIDLPATSAASRKLLVHFVLPGMAAMAGWLTHSWLVFALLAVAATVFAGTVAKRLDRNRGQRMETAGCAARQRVADFVAAHPDWHVRLYQTPAGLRALVMHRTFDADEPAAQEFFRALHSDPVYVRMCRNQKCFRARVSPKPWRVGMIRHIRPRPGVWPVRTEHLALRREWIAEYENRARSHASCRLIATLGSPTVDPKAFAVQTLHDELSQAASSLPLA